MPPLSAILGSKRSRASRQWGVVFMLINVVCWGAALPVVKPALDTVSPFEYLFLRFAFACVFSAPILIWYLWNHPALRAALPRILAAELVGTTIALGLLYEGLARTSSLEASLLVSTMPVFITLGGIFFLHEREETHEWLGLGLAMLGTLILVFEPLWRQNAGEFTFSLWGNTLIILQNVATMGYFLLAKRWYTKLPKFFISSVSFWVGAVTFLLLSLWQSQQSSSALFSHLAVSLETPAVLGAALYMAIFGSLIGLTAYIAGQDRMETSEASLFTYLQPLVALPLAWFWLQEPVTLPLLIATGLILCGVVVAEWLRRPSGRRNIKKIP